jgi:hypothetical protein
VALNVRCAICGQHQVGGILSSAAWGRLAEADGPLACPNCVEKHPDWRDRLQAAAPAP